jgi:hypothetical protein
MRYTSLTGLFISVFSFCSPVLAAVIGEPGGTDTDPVGQVGFRNGNAFLIGSFRTIVAAIFSNGLNIFFVFLASMALVLLLISGIQYITANGNLELQKKARQSIVNIILAIIIVTISYAAINLLVAVLRSLASTIS